MKLFRKILVDVDAMAAAQPALDRAAALARATGAALRIVDVISLREETSFIPDPDAGAEVKQRHRQRLEAMAEHIRDLWPTCDVLVGPPVETLVREVQRFGYDLVVRSHVRDLVSGGGVDVAARLLRECPCSVLAVGAGSLPPRPKIAASVDATSIDVPGQCMNVRVLDLAELLASQDGTLTVLQVWQPFFERRVQARSTDDEFAAYVDRARLNVQRDVDRLLASCRGEARVELRRGRLWEVIPEWVVAEGIDLLVIGNSDALSEWLIHKLPCSLLTVRLS
jgi:universal stress protein E